jgi:hypothetical protein
MIDNLKGSLKKQNNILFEEKKDDHYFINRELSDRNEDKKKYSI